MTKLKPGDRVADRYQIISQIGLGGQGVVYEARDQRVDRRVALKVMRLTGGEMMTADEHHTRLQRFRREAQTLAQLTHPNIIDVVDYGEAGDTVYIATEYFDGLTVDEWGARERLTVSEWLRVARRLLAALHYAHRAGVIHRDIKAPNVLVRGPKDAPEIKIIDWGVAFAESKGRLTFDGVLVGTLGASMDPAYFLDASRAPSVQSDLYAFGVLLYSLLCRAPPWQGVSSTSARSSDADAIVNAYFDQEVVAPNEIDAAIPDALSDVVMSLMSLDPAERPATAIEVLASLEEIEREIGGAPVGKETTLLHDAPSAVNFTVKAEPKSPRSFVARVAQIGKYSVFFSLNVRSNFYEGEWEGSMELLREMKANTGGDFSRCRAVCVADFGAPNALQRAAVKKLLDGSVLTTAVVTNNRLIHGVVTAMRWINPGMRSFGTSHYLHALDFVDLASHEDEVRRHLLSLQEELPARAVSLSLALAAKGRAAG